MGRGNTDQIFTVKEVLTTCYEYKIPAVALFTDFRKAYDAIKRSKLVETLKALRVPKKIINLVKMTLDNTSSNIRSKNVTSRSFKVGTSLRQEGSLSTLLLNATLEKAIRDSKLNRETNLNSPSGGVSRRPSYYGKK